MLDILCYVEKAIMVICSKKGNSGCKVFGTQHMSLPVDVWYGWLNKEFRDWLNVTYLWILLIFVLARCTFKFQPCNLGRFCTTMSSGQSRS